MTDNKTLFRRYLAHTVSLEVIKASHKIKTEGRSTACIEAVIAQQILRDYRVLYKRREG